LPTCQLRDGHSHSGGAGRARPRPGATEIARPPTIWHKGGVFVGSEPVAAFGGGRFLLVSPSTGKAIAWKSSTGRWATAHPLPALGAVSASWTGHAFPGRHRAAAPSERGHRACLRSRQQPVDHTGVPAAAALGPHRRGYADRIGRLGLCAGQRRRVAHESERPVRLGLRAAPPSSRCCPGRVCRTHRTSPRGGHAVVVVYSDGIGDLPGQKAPAPGSSVIYDIPARRWLAGPPAPARATPLGSAGSFWTPAGVVMLALFNQGMPGGAQRPPAAEWAAGCCGLHRGQCHRHDRAILCPAPGNTTKRLPPARTPHQPAATTESANCRPGTEQQGN